MLKLLNLDFTVFLLNLEHSIGEKFIFNHPTKLSFHNLEVKKLKYTCCEMPCDIPLIFK